VVLAAGFFGGVWMPESLQEGQSWNLVILLGILGIPLTTELLFRSLAHGLLTQGAKIQRNDTRWFISWPIAGSTIVYVVYIMSLLLISSEQNSSIQLGRLAISLSSAALFGLSLGMVRERSQSLFPAILFHLLAAATVFIVTRLI
jgi:membrane protease YdiL (CAAX protease family)